jgi:hypothetical protein
VLHFTNNLSLLVILILNCLSLFVLKIYWSSLRCIEDNRKISILSTIRAYLTNGVKLTICLRALTDSFLILMLLDYLLLEPICMVCALRGHSLVNQVSMELLFAAITVHRGILVKVLEKVAV